jgi:hypothetical protein
VFEFDQPDLGISPEPLVMGSTCKDREAFIESVRQDLRNSTVPNTSESDDEPEYRASWWDRHGEDILDELTLEVLIDALIISQ